MHLQKLKTQKINNERLERRYKANVLSFHTHWEKVPLDFLIIRSILVVQDSKIPDHKTVYLIV